MAHSSYQNASDKISPHVKEYLDLNDKNYLLNDKRELKKEMRKVGCQSYVPDMDEKKEVSSDFEKKNMVKGNFYEIQVGDESIEPENIPVDSLISIELKQPQSKSGSHIIVRNKKENYTILENESWNLLMNCHITLFVSEIDKKKYLSDFLFEKCFKIVLNKDKLTQIIGISISTELSNGQLVELCQNISTEVEKLLQNHKRPIYILLFKKSKVIKILKKPEEFASNATHQNEQEKLQWISFFKEKVCLEKVIEAFKKSPSSPTFSTTAGQFNQNKQKAFEFNEGNTSTAAFVSNYQENGDIDCFKTNSDLIVKVYQGNILHLDVDGIVNAANKFLSHGAGVAKAIIKAAGDSVNIEGRAKLKDRKLKDGDVLSTSAGDLKRYKNIIHAIGPIKNSSTTDEYCRSKIAEAVYNSLQEANDLGLSSIALPAISSGIFGVPLDVCINGYYLGVNEFCKRKALNCQLEEVHFVDMNQSTCNAIKDYFAKQVEDI